MTVSNAYPDCQSASQRERLLALSWLFVVVICGIVIPTPALAASASLGDLICNVKNNGLSMYPSMVNAVAYIAGAFMGVRSIFLFRKHAENPGQPQTIPATAHMLAAGALLSFPAFASAVQQTVFKQVKGVGSLPCQAGSISGGGSVSLDLMMENFVKNIYSPIFVLLSMISIMAGLTMLYQGLMRASKTGTDPRAAAPKDIVVNLVFGAILISIGTTLTSTLETLFGSSTISSMTNISIIKWSSIDSSGGGTAEADKVVRAVLAFVQIIGGIAFLRGWLLMKSGIESGQSKMPQALTHIIAGAMAINIDKMLKILNDTFGVDVIS